MSLSGLDPSIYLVDIDEAEAEYDREIARRSIHPGQRMSARTRRSLTVRLKIHITTQAVITRAAVMDKIASWCGSGGWLTISTRPNQRLYVVPDGFPAMGSSLRWTDEITLALVAYEQPYWQQVHPTVAVITETGTITPTGSYPIAYAECDIVNAGDGELTRVEIRCGETAITLDRLTVPAGGRVTLAYTDRDVLTIKAAGVSVLANRTAESHDDLIAKSRESNGISVAADQPVSATFRVRGRYW